MASHIILQLIMMVVFILLTLLATLSEQLELNVSITADYTPALDEVPGKLGPNEFTAGSVLSLNCLVHGRSNNGSLRYSWTVSGRSSTPSCYGCYPVTSTSSQLHLWAFLLSYHAGNYTCSASEIETPAVIITSPVFIVKVAGAGMFAYSGGRSRVPTGPIPNNGLIINELPRLECSSNSTLTGQKLGNVTTPDGIILYPGERSGDLLLHNPFSRPGLLRFEPRDSNRNYLPLKSSDQGVYTCSIPDSNGLVFSFNVGMYPLDFNVIPTITVLEYDKEDETLNCVSNGSVATIVSWTKDGVDINIDGDYYTFSQTITNRRSSTYSNVLSVGQGEFTTGNYSCTVSNALGEDTTSLVIIVPSEAPEMLTAVAGEREVVFSWSLLPVTQRNGIITSYSLSCSPSPSSSLPQSLPPQLGTLSVTGFSPNTQYSCSLVAFNHERYGPPATTNFTTLEDYSFFELHLKSIHTNCHQEISFERSKKLEQITSAIVKVLANTCRECGNIGLIDNQFFTCDLNSPSYLIYRARIEGTSEMSSSYFISLIEDWVRDGASVIVTGVLMTVKDQCSINITSLNSGLKCSHSPSHSSLPTAYEDETRDTAIAIVGAIIIFAVFITLTTIVVMCLVLRCKKSSISRNRKNTADINTIPNEAYNTTRMCKRDRYEDTMVEVVSSRLVSNPLNISKIEEETLYDTVSH